VPARYSGAVIPDYTITSRVFYPLFCPEKLRGGRVTSEDTLNNEIISSGVVPDDAGCCPECGSATSFGMNKDLGYYKRCPKCGYTVNLKRRFLGFDRHSRQWQ